MKNLIPCRFHIEVESVLKSEGLRATQQRLDIWDELSSTNKHRDIETILVSLKKKKLMFLELLFIEQSMYSSNIIF